MEEKDSEMEEKESEMEGEGRREGGKEGRAQLPQELS